MRERLTTRAIVPYWIQAELIAIATDLAEFIGAAVGFQLLFGIRLIDGAAITATATVAILILNKKGQKPLEMTIGVEPLVGKAASILFGVSLIASGLSSTVVGTMAGQVVMQGFVRMTIPMWLRRSITMAPSFVVISLGINTTQILVMSQVALSFCIALAIIPLVLFTARSDIMGRHTNSKTVTTAGSVIIGLVLLLNAYLLTTLS